MQSNLAEKLERPDGESLEGLSDTIPVRKSIEEIRADARAKAAARGMTLEESLDEFERFSGCKEYVDALRVLYGILT